MLTRQAVSPVSFIRRWTAAFAAAAIVIISALVVASVLSYAARPVAIERGPVEQAAAPIADRDFGDITVVSNGSTRTIDNAPSFIEPQYRDLYVDNGGDYSHRVRVEYDDKETTWSDSVEVASGARGVVLEGPQWNCYRDDIDDEHGARVKTMWRCKRNDLPPHGAEDGR